MGKVRPKKSRKMPTKQGKGRSPINGARPPVERQFGQPNGNPRSNGSWKKEDTLRYKLERPFGRPQDQTWAEKTCDFAV